MLARSLDNLQHQDFGYHVQGRVTVGLEPPARHVHAASAVGALSRHRAVAGTPSRRARIRTRAVQPAHPELGQSILVAGHPPNVSTESGASWDRGRRSEADGRSRSGCRAAEAEPWFLRSPPFGTHLRLFRRAMTMRSFSCACGGFALSWLLFGGTAGQSINPRAERGMDRCAWCAARGSARLRPWR
jgi:hypothetical protein